MPGKMTLGVSRHSDIDLNARFGTNVDKGQIEWTDKQTRGLH